MRRVFASALFAGLLAAAFSASADEAQIPVAAPARPSQPKPNAAQTAIARTQAGPKVDVSPVAVTAKRTHPHLELRLSADNLNRVLNESGVEPVAETDTPVDTVEVTARRVQLEPITQGIPALYYGITHPSEAWRIFAPIQP